MITSRIYAIIGLVCFAALSSYYIYCRPNFILHENPLYHHNIETIEIGESWIDYIGDCGGDNILENSVHTKLTFNEKYENNMVTWTGVFAEAKPKKSSMFFFGNDHYLSLLVKMQPSESAIFADLVLSVSQEAYM